MHNAAHKTPDQPLDDMDKDFFGHPRPLKGLFFTELWERFSYYGIRPLLILYMSAMVVDGGLGLDKASAAALVGVFGGSLYLMTVLGGWIADNWLGQARAVWYGSLLIAAGHLSIALNAFLDNFFFYFGLLLIVLGSGLFKTCISVVVGTLYAANDARRDAGYSIFYMGINIGSFVAPLMTGLLVEHYGWHLGFGIGGIGMLLSLLTFRLFATPQLQQFNQSHHYAPELNQAVVKNPYAPKIVAGFLFILAIAVSLVTLGIVQINLVVMATYLTLLIFLAVVGYFTYLMFFSGFNRQQRIQVLLCFILLISSALFWSTFEQQPTSFNLFARDYTDRVVLGFEIPTVWFQSLNAFFIITCAPIMAWLWIKLSRSNINLSYITKFIIALLLAAAGFLVMGFASQTISTHQIALVSPLWLVASYFLLAIGELCLSPVGLAAMSLLAPVKIRGQMMGLWFSALALGNLMAGLIGGEMLSSSIENLPTLFFKCVFALLIGAIILFLVKFPIQKLMAKDPSPTI